MRGILRKDIYCLKKRGILLLAACLLMMGLPLIIRVSFTFYIPSVYTAFVVIMTLFTWDETEKWNLVAGFLPVTPEETVKERYLITFVSYLICTVPAVILDLVTRKFSTIHIPYNNIAAILMILFSVWVLLLALPLTYRFGGQKLFLALMFVAFGLGALGRAFGGHLIGTVRKSGAFPAAIRFLAAHPYIPVLCMIGFIILSALASYTLSVHIYKKNRGRL